MGTGYRESILSPLTPLLFSGSGIYMEELQPVSWDENRLGWLGLAWFEGFGARSLRKLRARYQEDGMKAFRATRDELLRVGILERLIDRFIHWRSGVDPTMFARRLDAESIQFLLDGPDIPDLLRSSSDPPAALFLRGAPLHLKRPIAIVGTRAITPYGTRVTEQLCKDFVAAGCEIISGLAWGIDAKAHESTLDASGHTVALLAGGCNDGSITPHSNFNIGQRILKQGGSLVTEFPPGTESFKHHFPLRNRLIASLSLATVVIEAAEASGSLITARLALEENRDVFAVPGPITSEQSAGTNQLLKQGAIPCTSAQDILNALHIDSTPQSVSVTLTPAEHALLQMIDRPLHIDDIIRAAESSPASISTQLSMLELKGCIEAQGGGIYHRTPRGKIYRAHPPD